MELLREYLRNSRNRYGISFMSSNWVLYYLYLLFTSSTGHGVLYDFHQLGGKLPAIHSFLMNILLANVPDFRHLAIIAENKRRYV